MSPRWRFLEGHHRCGAGRISQWLVPVALLALTPKCVLCVLVWLGLGTTVAGLNGRELCGAPRDWVHLIVTTSAWLGVAGFTLWISRRWNRKTSRVAER